MVDDRASDDTAIDDDAAIDALPGWFFPADRALFRLFLGADVPSGDLAELGVYMGKSAALVGSYQRSDEQLTVVDLFGVYDDVDAPNRREGESEYRNLDRAAFERNYLALHARLPTIVQGDSTAIRGVAAHGTHRFVHVDASHLYAHVRADVDTARLLLRPDGVVALDDFRSPHTPGVAAAAWEAVASGLHPIVVSPVKMYATWGDPEPWLRCVRAWLPSSGLHSEEQDVAGNRVVRVWSPTHRAARWIPPIAVPHLLRLRGRTHLLADRVRGRRRTELLPARA